MADVDWGRAGWRGIAKDAGKQETKREPKGMQGMHGQKNGPINREGMQGKEGHMGRKMRQRGTNREKYARYKSRKYARHKSRKYARYICNGTWGESMQGINREK